MVSVRYDPPGRLSEPISRKLTVSVSVTTTDGSGASPAADGRGGAAAVGNNEFRSTVGLGSSGGTAVGEAVAVGKNGSNVGTSIWYSDVGVACSRYGGWNGVGVGDASGAAVISTSGADACGG
jgi:hypothetical protein